MYLLCPIEYMHQSRLYSFLPNELGSFHWSLHPSLFAVNENPILEWLKGLLTRRPRQLAENQLGLEAPLNRQIPFLGDSCVDHWAIMLQIASKSLGLEQCPNY